MGTPTRLRHYRTYAAAENEQKQPVDKIAAAKLALMSPPATPAHRKVGSVPHDEHDLSTGPVTGHTSALRTVTNLPSQKGASYAPSQAVPPRASIGKDHIEDQRTGSSASSSRRSFAHHHAKTASNASSSNFSTFSEPLSAISEGSSGKSTLSYANVVNKTPVKEITSTTTVIDKESAQLPFQAGPAASYRFPVSNSSKTAIPIQTSFDDVSNLSMKDIPGLQLPPAVTEPREDDFFGLSSSVTRQQTRQLPLPPQQSSTANTALRNGSNNAFPSVFGFPNNHEDVFYNDFSVHKHGSGPVSSSSSSVFGSPNKTNSGTPARAQQGDGVSSFSDDQSWRKTAYPLTSTPSSVAPSRVASSTFSGDTFSTSWRSPTKLEQASPTKPPSGAFYPFSASNSNASFASSAFGAIGSSKNVPRQELLSGFDPSSYKSSGQHSRSFTNTSDATTSDQTNDSSAIFSIHKTAGPNHPDTSGAFSASSSSRARWYSTDSSVSSLHTSLNDSLSSTKSKEGMQILTDLYDDQEEKDTPSDLSKLYDRLNFQAYKPAPPVLPSVRSPTSPSGHERFCSVDTGIVPRAQPQPTTSVGDLYKDPKPHTGDEETTRYVLVRNLPAYSGVDGKMSEIEITEAFKKYGELRGIFTRHLSLTGTVVLSFIDLRDAAKAREKIPHECTSTPAWECRKLQADFISRNDFIKLAEEGFDSRLLSIGEGKLTIWADANLTFERLRAFFSEHGDLKSFRLDSSSVCAANKRVFQLEYYHDRSAVVAYLRLREEKVKVENPAITAEWHDPATTLDFIKPSSLQGSYLAQSQPARPELPPTFPQYPDERLQRYRKTAWSDLAEPTTAFNSSLPDGFRSATVLPPTPNSQSSSFSLANLGYVPNDPSRSTTSAWGLIRDDPVPDANLIRFDMLESGQDTRTSCILRNLPNRMTQLELMANLDEIVPREYDFVYLRFDFNSGSNCGFGFVNFTSTQALLKFWKARLSQFWDERNSRKLCMGGMAQLQGKRALIERFRNSSVMDQDPAYQPKIFYSAGPSKGLPEPFPPSNNAMRKAKSAYATGLYGLYGNKPKGGFKHVHLRQFSN